jgi:succinylglutamate desuccinylase
LREDKQKLKSQRIIQYIKGKEKGPKLVFFGGLHGNEPAGVIALEEVLKDLIPANIKGEVYGVYGNLKALQQRTRFIEKDLNRIWTNENIAQIRQKLVLSPEEEEQKELLQLLSSLLENNEDPIYFIDFHTTSSPSVPFITINDALINRAFSKRFPVPIVLGIEEYLQEPLLSYLNKEGYVSLGFEAGQHEDLAAISSCKAFIYMALVISGATPKEKVLDYNEHYQTLRSQANDLTSVFEVVFRYHIKPFEKFTMNPGFKSFQRITKGEDLAVSDGQSIKAPSSAHLFMPLYQKQGEDGFFIIREIPSFFLRLSALLRRLGADQILTLLPGITWIDKEKGILRANLKVTRFMAKSVFHLLGYRSRQEDESYALLHNRERVARNNLYKSSTWYSC